MHNEVKRYELYNGTKLLLRVSDLEGSGVGIRCHGRKRHPVPTVKFFISKNPKRLAQRDVQKAASRIIGMRAVLTEAQIELSVAYAVLKQQDGLELAEVFVAELNRLQKARAEAQLADKKSAMRVKRTVRR